MASRQTNAAGYALIEQWEAVKLTAYRDIAGVWTIGYGHTGGVQKGQVISSDQAYQLLCADLRVFEDFVDARCGDAPTTDNQFAAMVSLAFNIGNGGFQGSTVLRQHKDGNYGAAAGAFLLWDKAHVNGQLMVVKGLLNRRMAEQNLYLSVDQGR
jgi:lysozyme